MGLFFSASLRRPASAVLLMLAFAIRIWAEQPEPERAPAADWQAGAAAAQPTPNRLAGGIDGSQLRPLAHHLPLWARAENDLGPASSEMALTLVLSRSPEQQAALEKLLADQKNPSSQEYRHWLIPVEMGERFGLSEADVQTVTSWLTSQGLQVKWTAPSRTFIGFGGPAAAVGRAFGTEVHRYRVNGEERVSVSSDPMIPAALGSVVTAIHGLYTVEVRPAHSMHVEQAVQPQLTLANGMHFITPMDFQEIYDGVVSASGYRQTIGIVGLSRTDPDDFTNFRRLTYSGMQNPTEVVPTAFGGTDPGPALTSPPSGNGSVDAQSEATLDVLRAGSVAPNATTLLVIATAASGGIGADAQYLIQTTPVPAQAMSISFSACESSAGPAGVVYWDTLFQQAAAEGISVFVSSGDSGASGCEPDFTTPMSPPPAISPNFLCSSSYVTCVGGTEFNDASSGSTYWGTSNGTNLASAQSYIPEGGWNEPLNGNSGTQVAASGGGASSVIATPAWQSGPGVPAARSGRYTPDISFSSSCHDAYFGCFAAGGGSCVAGSGGSYSFIGFCGTSAAAPSMAGVLALLDEKMGAPLGNINPEIYSLAQNAPSSIHDATPATSGASTCDINIPSMCNNSSPGPTGLSGGQAGYAVTTGYDLVTGVGSPDILKFVTNLPGALPAPTVTVTPSATTITSVQSLTVTISVAGGSGQLTPTGSVQLTSGPYASALTPLAAGTATVVIPPESLPWSVDTETLTAQYRPDGGSAGTYASATGSAEVGVMQIVPTMTVAFSPQNPTTAQNVAVTVTVDGGSGNPTPTGTVSINNVVATGTEFYLTGTLSGGQAVISIPAGMLAPASDRIDAHYAADAQGSIVYGPTLGSGTVTVTAGPKTTPTVNVNLSSSSVAITDGLTATIGVVPAAGGVTPTGTVSLASGGHTLSAALSNGVAQIAIPAGWLPVGNDPLAISYPGDYNNLPASTSAMVSAVKGTVTLIVTTMVQTLNSNQPLDVTVQVQTPAGTPTPTGTVTLTAGSYTSPATALLYGSGSIGISSNVLPVGTIPLSATYSGDGNYNSANGSGSITVIPPESFSINGSTLTISTPGQTQNNVASLVVNPANGFTGVVTLTAAVTSTPSLAEYVPTVSLGSTGTVNITGPGGQTALLTVYTTAPTFGHLSRPSRSETPWSPMGETALACLLLAGFGVRRRRIWQSLLGMMLLIAALASAVSACGGGGGGNSGGGSQLKTTGTTPGTYVVTVTGTGGGLTATTTVNVVVQ